MPLDPSISLQARGIDIQQPDYLRAMLTAAQLKQMQQQAAMAQLQFQQAQQEAKQAQDFQGLMQGWAQGQGQGGTSPMSALGQAASVPPAPQGSYAQTPPGYSALTPNTAPLGAITQTPLGETSYTRAPAAMQPTAVQASPAAAAQAPPGGMPRTSELFPNFPWQKAMAMAPERTMKMMDVMRKAQLDDLTGQKARMEIGTQAIDYLQQVAGSIHDQTSLDAARQDLMQRAGPEMGRLLPETYTDKATFDTWRQNLIPLKQRLQSQQTGLTPMWGRDAQTGQTIPLQPNQQGEIVRSKVPEGVTVLAPTGTINQGNQVSVYEKPGGAPVSIYEKNQYTGAFERKQGEELGARAAKLPELKRQAQAALQTLDQKQDVAVEDIDRVLKLAEKADWPTTGFYGDLLSGIKGTPGYDMAQLLQGVKGRVGLTELQSLKSTGTGLGQVTEGEHRLLQSQLGSLEQGQSKEQFLANLTRLKSYLQTGKARRWEMYRDEFERTPAPTSQRPGNRGQGQTPQTSPYGHIAVDQLSPEQADAEERWLKQQLGAP